MERVQAELLVRIAGRAIGRAGLAHAYGHCSQRLDDNHFIVCAPVPMGLLEIGESGTMVPVHGSLPDGVLGEVRIHQEIYARRPDVCGVCRTMPKDIMALSTLGLTPRPRHGFGAYFAPGIPLWDDPQLIRDRESAVLVADLMGHSSAIVMRGNGLVTAAESIEAATVLNWYAEDAARIELSVLASGQQGVLIQDDEAAKRATRAGRIFERMWDYLTAGDPELAQLQAII